MNAQSIYYSELVLAKSYGTHSIRLLGASWWNIRAPRRRSQDAARYSAVHDWDRGPLRPFSTDESTPRRKNHSLSIVFTSDCVPSRQVIRRLIDLVLGGTFM